MVEKIPVVDELSPVFSLGKTAVLMGTIWSVFNLAAVGWHMMLHEREIDMLLQQVGRATIGRDILYRQWNAFHGGVYVPVTEASPSNPYLSPEIVPERDEVTLSGRRLTMINPAYMTRQVYELARERHEVSGHITSLNPINPANQPKAWEAAALEALRPVGDEYVEFAEEDGERVLRMLLPLRTEKSCLRCHAGQGYVEGDLRGGISVTIPVEAYHGLARWSHRAISLTHLAIWLVGMLGIFWGYKMMAPKEAARLATEREIIKLAHFDALTGLANRTLFQEHFRHALTIAQRRGEKVALLYLDLDQFKPINDRYGHEAGDAVLREVAARLRVCVRESDMVARVGGDEFVILLEGLADRQQAGQVAEKVVQALQEPFGDKGNSCVIGASIGISCFPEDGTEHETLLQKADAAMYEVKNRQRGATALPEPRALLVNRW